MNSKKEVQHVYLVGAKSLGAYGGYETFVYKLTEYHQNKENIKYHVACKANGDGCMDESKFDGVTRINEHEFELHNAHCFKIDVPQIGPAQAIYYDAAALKACCEHIKENHIPHPIVYIMACRIGPFAGYFYRKIHKLGGTVYLNPDGHEWMRAKWSAPIRKYWKISEQMMVKYCDLAICDSVNMDQHLSIEETGIQGLYVVNPASYKSDEDLIVETYNSQELLKYGLNMTFVQENQSMSVKGVLRGLHVQKNFPQGKLVRVVRGRIYDVAVDTRTTSSTYGDWYGVELSADNKKQFYIPEGFAHGFYVISDIAEVCFKVSDYWHPNDEIGIPWNDPELKINWPIKENEMPIIADKDLHYDSFSLLKEKLVQREE